MGRPQKKSKNKRKANRNQQANSNGHHSRHEEPEEEPSVSFDPDPPVAGDDDDDSGSESDDASLIFDTVRVPEVALNCAIQAIQLGAVGLMPPKMKPPPPPPPRRPAPAPTPAPVPNDEESHLSLVRYLSRKPGRRSRIRKGVPLNNIEPLVSYNRKMARVAPRAAIRTPTAQLNRERAAVLCPCNQVEESQIKSIRAVQLFMRSPRFFTLMQFTTAFAARLSAYRLMRENQIAEAQRAGVEVPQINRDQPLGAASNAQIIVNRNSAGSNLAVNGDQTVENGPQLNGESSVRQSNGALIEESAEDVATRAEQANGSHKTKEITKNGTVSDDDDASKNHKDETD